MKKYKIIIEEVEYDDLEYVLSLTNKEIIEKYMSVPVFNSIDRSNARAGQEFKLNEDQNSIYEGILENNMFIAKKDRQAGATSLLSAMIACEILRGKKVAYASLIFDPITVLRYVKKHLNEVFSFTNFLDKYDRTKDNSRDIEYSNGGSFHTLSENDLHYNFDWVILDEIAFLERRKASFLLDIITGRKFKKLTIVSNQNGIDDLFMPLYFLGNDIGFKAIKVGGIRDPREKDINLEDDWIDVLYEKSNKMAKLFGKKLTLTDFFYKLLNHDNNR